MLHPNAPATSWKVSSWNLNNQFRLRARLLLILLIPLTEPAPEHKLFMVCRAARVDGISEKVSDVAGIRPLIAKQQIYKRSMVERRGDVEYSGSHFSELTRITKTLEILVHRSGSNSRFFSTPLLITPTTNFGSGSSNPPTRSAVHSDHSLSVSLSAGKRRVTKLP